MQPHVFIHDLLKLLFKVKFFKMFLNWYPYIINPYYKVLIVLQQQLLINETFCASWFRSSAVPHTFRGSLLARWKFVSVLSHRCWTFLSREWNQLLKLQKSSEDILYPVQTDSDPLLDLFNQSRQITAYSWCKYLTCPRFVFLFFYSLFFK